MSRVSDPAPCAVNTHRLEGRIAKTWSTPESLSGVKSNRPVPDPHPIISLELAGQRSHARMEERILLLPRGLAGHL